MRVLQILHTEELGGVKTLADMIAEDLGRRGVTVDTVLLFARPDFGRAEKIKAAVAMARRLARDDHDAIFAYQATACILTGLFGRKLRIVHQTCTPGETQALVRLADRLVGTAGRYSVNVANTMFTLNEFRGYPEGYRKDMRLIEHGLDAPRAASGREETRRRFGLPEGAPLILNVGRMAAQKNQSVLIEALPAVPDATLAIAGHGGDGDMLTALAQRHGVADRLRLLGGVAAADVADLYAAADLFAFPSVWETFGLAGVEAAMSGAPIVASDIAVLREVLASEEPDAPVAFAPPHDVDAWRRALAQALATPASAERRAAFADEVSRRYARERMSAQYMELLEGRDLPAPPWRSASSPSSSPSSRWRWSRRRPNRCSAREPGCPTSTCSRGWLTGPTPPSPTRTPTAARTPTGPPPSRRRASTTSGSRSTSVRSSTIPVRPAGRPSATPSSRSSSVSAGRSSASSSR